VHNIRSSTQVVLVSFEMVSLAKKGGVELAL